MLKYTVNVLPLLDCDGRKSSSKTNRFNSTSNRHPSTLRYIFTEIFTIATAILDKMTRRDVVIYTITF